MTPNSKEEFTMEEKLSPEFDDLIKTLQFPEKFYETLKRIWERDIKDALSLQSKQHTEAIQKTQRELKERFCMFRKSCAKKFCDDCSACRLIDKIFKQNFNLDEAGDDLYEQKG